MMLAERTDEEPLIGSSFTQRVAIDVSQYKQLDRLLARMGLTIRQYGMVVLSNVIAPSALEPTVKRAQAFADDIDRYRKGQMTEEALFALYGRFNSASYAIRIIPFEQLADPAVHEIQQTQLFQILAASPLVAILRYLSSYRLAYGTPEIRISYPLENNLHQGGLRCHFEHSTYPCSHVMWMPMMQPSHRCNLDTPGMGFMVRERAEDERVTESLSRASELVDHLSSLNTDKLNERDLPDVYKDFWRFTPQVGLGDVILFDSMVPHFSFFPQQAKYPRISYDMRVFPESMQNLPETTRQVRESVSLKV